MSRQVGSLNLPFHTHPTFNVTLRSYHFSISFPIFYHHTLKNLKLVNLLKKLPITSNTINTSQDNRNPTRIAPQLQNLYYNQPLSLVPRNYRNTTLTEHIHPSNSYPQSPASHIVVHERNIDDTYEQIVE